jgi:hypothetical protein
LTKLLNGYRFFGRFMGWGDGVVAGVAPGGITVGVGPDSGRVQSPRTFEGISRTEPPSGREQTLSRLQSQKIASTNNCARFEGASRGTWPD